MIYLQHAALINFPIKRLSDKKLTLRKMLWAILILSASYPSFAQKPDSVITLRKLTDSIATITREQNIPGLMLGITTKDSVIFSGGFGYADVKTRRIVTSQTLFRMGSITKMFVSLGVLKLIHEEKLSLNDELKKIAPEVPFENKWESDHPVRLVNLFEHTAGFDDMKLNRMYSLQAKEFRGMEMMLLQKNSFVCRWKPGERTAYSNPGYVILGYIIKKLTGKDYDQYLAENILQPLGMVHSNFSLRSNLPEKEVKEYIVVNGKPEEVPTVTSLMGPAGSLWSCSDDMIRFLQFFLRNGQPLFPPAIIQEMETPQSSLAAKKGLSTTYALGNYTTRFYNKNPYRGHNGLTGTCYSSFVYNRETGIGYVLASNGNNPNFRIERLVNDFVEQGVSDPKPDTILPDIKSIGPFLGKYQFESPRNQIAGFKDRYLLTPAVFMENHSLYMKYPLQEKIKLIQTSPLTFAKEYANAPSILFTKNAEGKNVAIIDGGYYEQGSFIQVSGKQWVVAIAIFFILSAVVAAVYSLVAVVAGRLKWKKLIPVILPMMAVISLSCAVITLLKVEEQSYLLNELTYVGTRSLLIFTGTLLFAILSLLHLFLVIKTLRQSKNRLVAVYWLLTALSLCYILVILFQNGWIGLRTWAM